MTIRTSNLPFPARRPEVIGYGLLLGLEELAAEHEDGLDDAVDVLR